VRSSIAKTSSVNAGSPTLRRRDVDRDAEIQPGVGPGPALRQRLAEDERRQRSDEPGLFGDRDELVGRDVAELGMAPADEGLGTGDLAAAQVGLRW
jgi:hypothetical protein